MQSKPNNSLGQSGNQENGVIQDAQDPAAEMLDPLALTMPQQRSISEAPQMINMRLELRINWLILRNNPPRMTLFIPAF